MLEWLQSDAGYWALGGGLLVLGFILLITGCRGRRSKGRPLCRGCDYDLSGAPSLTCPECGRTHKRERDLLRPRRYVKRCAAGLVLVLLAGYAFFWPDIADRRASLDEPWYHAIVPTTVWIWLVPNLNYEQVRLLDVRLFGPDVPRVLRGGTSGGVGPGNVPVTVEYYELRPHTQMLGIWKWQKRLLTRSCIAVLDEPHPPRTVTDALGSDDLVDFVEGREHFASWLGCTLDETDDAIPTLLRILRQTHDLTYARVIAARMMQAVRQPSQPVIDAMVAAAEDVDHKVRREAVLTLGAFGQSDRNIVAVLTKAMDDRDQEVYFAAIGALGRLRPITAELLAAVRIAVHEGDGFGIDPLFRNPVLFLGAAAVPMLIEDMLSLADESGRADGADPLFNVLLALGAIGESAIPRLVQLLDHPDRRIEAHIIQVFQFMDEKAAAALPALRARLERSTDKDEAESLRSVIRDINEGSSLFPRGSVE